MMDIEHTTSLSLQVLGVKESLWGLGLVIMFNHNFLYQVEKCDHVIWPFEFGNELIEKFMKISHIDFFQIKR
jgi:hypothetical protein